MSWEKSWENFSKLYLNYLNIIANVFTYFNNFLSKSVQNNQQPN